MKNELKGYFGKVVPLTCEALKKLKDAGFRYVQVNAFTLDKRLDYMEPHYFVLMPLKNLPEDNNKKGIYEPIGSPLLVTWANCPDEGIQVFIATG